MAVNPNLEKISDAELVRLALLDSDVFLHIVNRYQGKLLSYIRRISNFSQEDAEDILQDVFIKIYRHLNEYDQELKFSSWIYRITHNQVISSFRRLKARPEGQTADLDEAGLNNLASEIDIAKEVDGEILKGHIQELLSRIDIKYREALVLKYLEEKSYEEISDILKKPIGTVGTLISRGKKQFKEEYEKLGKQI